MTTLATGRLATSGLKTGRRAGFTLIEILVVISLLVILIAALVANTIAVGQRAYRDSTQTLFRRIDLGMGTYTDRVGFFPSRRV